MIANNGYFPPPLLTMLQQVSKLTTAMIEPDNTGKATSQDSADNTLSGQTTMALREAIVTGEIKPGEKLNEPRLAEQFKVSRGPLREAIRRLVAMRLVRHVPHIGATVVTMSIDSVRDLYEVREALEGKAAALAARTMTPEQVTQLRSLLDIHRHHTETNAGEYMQTEGDFDFHYQIIKGCGNALLIHQLCDELYHLIRMFRFQTSRFKARSNRALIEHEQLIYAIEQGDSELSEMLMRKHISRAKTSILNSLATQS